MNLTSCNGCGVVVDKDKLSFPDDIWNDDDTVNQSLATWSRSTERFVASVKCPVCGEPILKLD